jgi:hypothetical protein
MQLSQEGERVVMVVRVVVTLLAGDGRVCGRSKSRFYHDVASQNVPLGCQV